MGRVRLLPGLRRKDIGREIVAGITLLAISVPLNIGYAQIAGLPASAGLYALILPTLVFALMASSRQLVASPDAAAAALVFSSLTTLGASGGDLATMAAAQAILGGIVLLLAAAFRLGFLANFLSAPVLVGFVGGLALEILLSQTMKILGVAVEGEGFFVEAIELLLALPELHPVSALIGTISIAVLLIGARFARRVPWALVVLVAATVTSAVWSLDGRGVAVLGVVDSGFPVLDVPRLRFSQWVSLLPSAIALAMITLSEGLLVSRRYARRRGYPVDPDRDLLAFGAANVAAGLSASFTVGASTSRTAAMDQAGARSQLPGIVLAVGALGLLLFGTELLEPVPLSAIGAVVVVAVLRLLGVSELHALWTRSRAEFAIAAACMLGVLVIGPLQGLLIAVVLSTIDVTRRAAAPRIDVLKGDSDPQASLLVPSPSGAGTAPGVTVLRIAAPIFFANASAVSARLRAAGADLRADGGALVLDLEAVTDVDVTGAEELRGAIDDLRELGVAVAYSRVRPTLRDRLVSLDLMDDVAEFPTNRAAVAQLAHPPTR